jgi:hypothetical protein
MHKAGWTVVERLNPSSTQCHFHTLCCAELLGSPWEPWAGCARTFFFSNITIYSSWSMLQQLQAWMSNCVKFWFETVTASQKVYYFQNVRTVEVLGHTYSNTNAGYVRVPERNWSCHWWKGWCNWSLSDAAGSAFLSNTSRPEGLHIVSL